MARTRGVGLHLQTDCSPANQARRRDGNPRIFFPMRSSHDARLQPGQARDGEPHKARTRSSPGSLRRSIETAVNSLRFRRDEIGHHSWLSERN